MAPQLLIDVNFAQFITRPGVSLERDFSYRLGFLPVWQRKRQDPPVCCLITRKMVEEGSQEGSSGLKIISGNNDTTLTIVFPATCASRKFGAKTTSSSQPRN